jgi:hypothetical protein
VTTRLAACAGLLVAAAGLSACAPHRLQLPSGDGEPFPGYAQAAREATASCREVRTLSAELAISGRAGGQKVRGRVTAGLAAPASVRLEGTAPFGPPVFILAAEGGRATLLLPRDNRVIAGEMPAAILEALVGLELRPSDLLAMLAGCVVPDPQPATGRLFPGGWARIDLAGDASMFLQRDARQHWSVRAGVRAPLRVEYEGDGPGTPFAVRVAVSGAAPAATDLRIALAQVDLNVPLAPEVFRVKIPADARPITLAELRQAGPMGDRR